MTNRPIPRLRRQSPSLAPRRKFFLFCEGRNTEPGYFNAIGRTYFRTSIELNGGVGNPFTIADKAVDFARKLGLTTGSRRRLNSFEEKDEVWAVFDRDKHPKFIEAINKCNANGIKIGRSNPCFEVWLILHFDCFERPDDSKQVGRCLKKYCKEYDPEGRKTLDCMALMESLKDAEGRAETQLGNRCKEGDPYGAPSTTVFQLTRRIREANEVSR
jgi:RloB-like protein